MNIFERFKQKVNLYKKPAMILTAGFFTLVAAMFYDQGPAVIKDGPILTPVTATEYSLVQNFQMTVKVPPHVYTILVKSNFVFDGASIPRAALTPLGLTPFSPTVIKGALLHDPLYRSRKLPRDIADEILRVVCLAEGTEPHKAEAIYVCVQAGGSVVWSNQTPESIAEAQQWVDVQIQ